MGFYRRNKEEKLTYRFYEPLALLKTLSRAQGDRVPLETLNADHVDTHDAVQARRTLLDQLSIVCDFDKGGSTTTAIALESRPCGPCYWVSSPKNTEKRTAPFVRRTLEILAEIALRPDDDYLKQNIRDRLFRHFAESCKPRLVKTWDLLQKAVNREETQVRSEEAQILLKKCRLPIRGSQADLLSFCDWAYRNRKSEHFRRPVSVNTQDQYAEFTVRHFIGRIASVARAAEILASIAPGHRELFEDFDIKAIPCGQVQPSPPFDMLITLDGIARRMEGNYDEYERLKEALFSLDRTIGLMNKIKEAWTDPNFKPRVHAEIELLEAIHRARVQFYEKDRYIACSKAACFCCYHYICHHPGQFVRPASHNNVWLSWCPPDLPQSSNETDATSRKKLLNAMVAEFRIVARSRVLDRSGRQTIPHPDSTTGITSTATVIAHSLQDIEEFDSDSASGSATALPLSLPDGDSFGLGSLQTSLDQLRLKDAQELEEDGGVPLNSSVALSVA